MESKNIVISILLITTIFLWVSLNTAKEEVIKWQDNYSETLEETSRYKEALSQANQNIEESNSTIEDAKGYLGESYDDMNNAIDGLEPAETVEL